MCAPWLHIAVLKAFAAATGAPVLAVSGNVDDSPGRDTQELLPTHRLLEMAGWRLLLVHIVTPGPTSKGGWVCQVLLLVGESLERSCCCWLCLRVPVPHLVCHSV